MKNTSLVTIVVLGLAIGGIGIVALMNGDTSMTKRDSMEKPEIMVSEGDTMMPKAEPAGVAADTMMVKEGQYVQFSPEVLASSANTKRVLFFYANWCPTCKPADASFTKNMAEIPADVTLIRVNYNDTETDQAEKDLAKKYGITYQHTFVQIDEQGNEVTKWNGGQINELVRNIQ